MSSTTKKSNDELVKEQKQIHHKPEDLMDTDVEEEFKEGDKKGFRKQNGDDGGAPSQANNKTGKPSSSTTSGSTAPNKEEMEQGHQMRAPPDEMKDTGAKNGGKSKL